MNRKILIDCDPGIDDAVAILMALAAPELDVVGITTVGGNVGVDTTTRNALAIATLASRGAPGRQVPVARGADLAMVADKRRAESVHGADGLGGVRLPEPAWAAVDAPAWDFIRDAAARSGGALEIVAIGPLTNVAMTLAAYPAVARSIRAIHIMGGSAGAGNATPAAEFNIYADPHAAAAVFQSGVPITMCGLDVTKRATLDQAGLEELRATGGRVLSPCCAMLDHYMAAYRRFGHDALALHDPLVIAHLVDPALVTFRQYRVDVETDGRFTTGKTVVDVHGVSKKAPNAAVGVDLDPAGFIALMTRLLRSYDGSGTSGSGTPGPDTSGPEKTGPVAR